MANAGLTISLAAAAASITDHPSTAAIVTLSVTVGTWILTFIAAVQGGLWERLARYTPTAMVGEFQHGLIRLDVVLASVTLIVTGLGVAAIWMRLGVTVRRRAMETTALAAISTVALVACTTATASWDTSESRRNSFSLRDEVALKAIPSHVSLEAHLAPEDPRRVDLEHHVLSKLRRVRPDVDVHYVSASSIGLFEQTRVGYGEVWIDVGGRKAMTRSTTEDAVLETIYTLARLPRPDEDEEAAFRGHPLASRPRWAASVFYLIWPALVLAAGFGRRHVTGIV